MKLKHFRLMAEEGDDGGGSGSGPSGGDAIGTGNDARIALLNSIGDQYDAIRAEDLADINDDGSTTPFAAPTTDEEETAEAPAEPVAEEETPTTQMITRKVNGKDVTLPLEDWLIRAQKVEAADEYLQDAARQRKEALRQEPQPAPVVPKGPSTEELAAQQLAERRQLARAIQMGTEEEAVAALEKLQNMGKTPTLTVEDVGRVADERLRFNTALAWFADEYKDLTGNPQLYNMVIEREAALVRGGDARPYVERYKEVGDEVRTWRDELIESAKPSVSAPPPSSLDAKRAAKAAAPKAPSVASTKAAPVQQEEEDDSASSVIAAMAKARGGPQWARG